MSRELAIGIVGATGLVGETFRNLLSKSKHLIKEIRPFASERSKGQDFEFRDQLFKVQVLADNCFEGLDIVFFSSGDPLSLEWAPKAVEQGAIVIDNSAAFRMSPDHPLVVPEVNFDAIKDPLSPQVIANPNCSTIQLVMVLNALKKFGLQSCRVASYQSVSGAGKAGIQDLLDQSQDVLAGKPPREGQNFNPSIAFECQPKIGSINDEGFCSEEVKIMAETKKILSMPDIKMSAFTVRVSREEIETTLSECSYVQYMKDGGDAPFHSYDSVSGETDAFVSRLRKDPDFDNTWMFWVVADNLYRGAASNGMLIADQIIDRM